MSECLCCRNTVLGEGMPEVCVPLTGQGSKEILEEARAAVKAGADLVEWRADFFASAKEINSLEKLEDGADFAWVEEMTARLRETLGEVPLIFTYRTEGLEEIVDRDRYVKVNEAAICSGAIDFIDVELFMGDEIVQRLVSYAHEHHVFTIVSNHDFVQTPDVDVLLERMEKMTALGGDIPKIAVMPNSISDVLKLMEATNIYTEKTGKGPVITMAMGKEGVVSRLCGEYFGSALTFGAVEKTSAPGQLLVQEMRPVLELLHEKGLS